MNILNTFTLLHIIFAEYTLTNCPKQVFWENQKKKKIVPIKLIKKNLFCCGYICLRPSNCHLTDIWHKLSRVNMGTEVAFLCLIS